MRAPGRFAVRRSCPGQGITRACHLISINDPHGILVPLEGRSMASEAHTARTFLAVLADFEVDAEVWPPEPLAPQPKQ